MYHTQKVSYVSLLVVLATLVCVVMVSPRDVLAQNPPADSTTPTDPEANNDSEDSSGDSSSDEPAVNSSGETRSDLEEKKREYEAKLDEAREQSNTLSSQIDYMDTQIYLAETKTEQTEARIEKTEEEIDKLGDRIEGLDSSLDDLSRLLLDRVTDSYKQRSVTLFDFLLDNESANDFFGQIKYYKTAQENNQKLLFQVQQTKSNFQQQKTLREKKKEDLDKLRQTLEIQRAELERQQQSKERLLSVTRNDEALYQQLIEEAERRIAAFNSFVQSTGVGTISAGSLGTGEGGWYLSQRDERWAGSLIGNSSANIFNVGCFITSISMVFRAYGYDMTPVTLATRGELFVPGSADMYHPSNFNGSWPGGKTYRNISGRDAVASMVNNGVPVIAEVFASESPTGRHYIVLKRVEDGDFIMNDPIYGPDLSVSDYYTFTGVYGIFQ